VPAELRGVLREFVWDSDKLQRLPLLVKTAAMLPLILQEAT
jgi:hypothetical protein